MGNALCPRRQPSPAGARTSVNQCRYCPATFARFQERDEHARKDHAEQVLADWRDKWAVRRRQQGNECKRCRAGFHCDRCACCYVPGSTAAVTRGQPVGYVQQMKSMRKQGPHPTR